MIKPKQIKTVCFFIALIFIFTQVLFSCESELDKEWNRIKDSGSIEDLMEFAVNPDIENNKYLDEANKKIKNIIKKEENSEKLNALLNQYPEWEIDLKNRIAEIAFNFAVDENTPEAFEEYIREFWYYNQNPEYIQRAEETLKDLYFNIAKEQKSLDLLEEFILRYENYDSILAEEAAKIIDEINVEIEWNEVLIKYKAENSLLPLINFTGSYPDSVFYPEAEKLIKQIRDDSSYSDKYLIESNIDLIDEFVLNFPGHKDIDKALKLREDFSGDIYSMIEKEYISAVSLGDSITRNRIIIQNRTDLKLEVKIPFGIYLAANSGSVQNMAVREEKTVIVEPEQRGSIYINTACMNIYKDIPDDRNYFTVDILPEDSRLIKILKVLKENNSSFEIAQAAIWYIMDNPGKDVILETLVYESKDETESESENEDIIREWAITEEDYDEALRLIELAGIKHE